MTSKKKAPQPKPKAPTTKAPPAKPITTPTGIDWERIEIEYRAGAKSVREIAYDHKISHTLINRRKKAQGWTRDLSAKVKAKADALVSKDLVSREVSTETRVTESVVVEVEAQVQARIRLTHRTDIARNRNLAQKLVAELEHQTDHGDLYETLADLVQPTEEEESTEAGKARARRLREAYNMALSLGGRTKTMKDLADTLRILVVLEREAYGLETKGGGGTDGLPAVTFKDLTGRKA